MARDLQNLLVHIKEETEAQRGNSAGQGCLERIAERRLTVNTGFNDGSSPMGVSPSLHIVHLGTSRPLLLAFSPKTVALSPGTLFPFSHCEVPWLGGRGGGWESLAHRSGWPACRVPPRLALCGNTVASRRDTKTTPGKSKCHLTQASTRKPW